MIFPKLRWAFSGILALILSTWLGFAAGETAVDLTESVRFETNGAEKNFTLMTDQNLQTYFPVKAGAGTLNIQSDTPIHGIYFMLFDKFGKDYGYNIQICENDQWKTVVQETGGYLVRWHSLTDGVSAIRITATLNDWLRIAEIRLFGEGEPPPEIQRWQTLDKADLMLLTAHPDDEILWFAGLMPVYGGERKLKLQVVLMVPTGGQRKLEVLSAIWHCGVHYYPEMLGFVDKNGQNPENQYKLWRGESRVISRVVEMIRKHRPEVLITHGEKGEYGHGAHKTAADAAKKAVRLSGQGTKHPRSAEKYGTWQVKKLYLHEYRDNPITCDWNQPLEAFAGKTGYEVAAEAFHFHDSQIRRDWTFEIHGKHDNAQFGLYYTEVGKDTGLGDLMEHIELMETDNDEAWKVVEEENENG